MGEKKIQMRKYFQDCTVAKEEGPTITDRDCCVPPMNGGDKGEKRVLCSPRSLYPLEQE